MKKSRFIRVVSLIAAVMLLSGALVAAVINGSPYETIKNAVFDMSTIRNATIECETSLIVNGVMREWERKLFILGDDSRSSYTVDMDSKPFWYDFDYLSDTLYVTPYFSFSDEDWFRAIYYPKGDAFDSRWVGVFTLTEEDRNSAEFRFIEVLADTLVGDLKNNFSVSTNDGVRRISGAVTERQLPELVKVGLELVAARTRDGYAYFGNEDMEAYHDELDRPMQSIAIDYIRIDGDVDAEGHLLYLECLISATATDIAGTAIAIETGFVLRLSDFGTSIAQCPIPGVEEILTPALFESMFSQIDFVSPKANVLQLYFALGSDGAIDMDSISTSYPDARLR